MNKTNLKRSLAVGASVVAAFAFAAPAYAGEDDDERRTRVHASGGGSDSGSASGGVQTGVGGALATTADDNNVLPLALIGGGVLMLTASGLTFKRRLAQDAL